MNLHEKALELVRQYQRVEAELVETLRAIDDRRLYREHRATSLFVYATKILGLSESVAWNFITVSRATKKSPVLKEAIEHGELSVSKARRITSVLTLENQSEWVEKAKTLSQRGLEKAVAKENPKAITPDRASYVTADYLKLEIGLSESELEEVKYVQDLVCQSRQSAASLRDTILEAVRFYRHQKDPVEKAKRARAAKPVPSQAEKGSPKHAAPSVTHQAVPPASAQVDQPDSSQARNPVRGQEKPRPGFSATLLHEIARRDQNRCVARNPDGSRCESRRWLDVHHVVPKSRGGTNAMENLATLCRAHHQIQHRQPLGPHMPIR